MSYPGSYGTKNNQKFPLQHCQQQIPPGWITQFDQKSKRNFYVDTRTGQSHWVLPNLVHHPQQYQQPAPQYQPPQQYQPPVIQQYQPPHYQSQIPQHYQQPMIPQNHRPANFQYQQSALSHNQIQQSLPNFHQNTVEPHQFNDVSLPKHNTFPSYKPQSLPNLHTFKRPGYQSPPSLDYQSPHTSHYLPATQVYENVASQSHPPARLQNPPPAQQATASPQYQYIKPSSMHRISWGKPLKHDDAVGQAKSLIVAFNDSEKARDEALISFLSTYSPIQIKQVDEIYSKLTSGKKIKEKICDKGDFGKLLEALLMYEEGEFDAFCIRDALTGGLLKDEDTLIEILVGRTNEDINSILIAYNNLYNIQLNTEIKKYFTGNFGDFMVKGVLQGRMNVNAEADIDCNTLYTLGENRKGCDEEAFINIFCSRTLEHLKEVFELYEKKYKKDIKTVIKKEFKGDIEKGFLAIVKSAIDNPKKIAASLRNAMKGFGTNDKQLIRLIVTNREPKRMGAIKRSFEESFGKSLFSYVKDDTSGTYRALLCRLIEAV